MQRNTVDMKRFVWLYIVAMTLLPMMSWAQDGQAPVRVAFWNEENFFDPFVDSARTYNDFTEDGIQHWTKNRFYNKRNKLYKTILAMSESRPLGVLGLSEVENEYVLISLFDRTPLKEHRYRWVHYEGSDKRGIESAIVYSLDHFILVESATIPCHNSEDTTIHSRDILYAKFIPVEAPALISDTLHVFVNHWPSRYTGQLETMGSRSYAARLLRQKVDSIMVSAPKGYQPKTLTIALLTRASIMY